MIHGLGGRIRLLVKAGMELRDDDNCNGERETFVKFYLQGEEVLFKAGHFGRDIRVEDSQRPGESRHRVYLII